MARQRYNGLVASLGAELGAAATNITFAAALTHSGGTAVPTISGSDYIPLTILDANKVPKERVNLTAYTSGALTGTIARAQEGTAAAAHDLGRTVVLASTTLDFTAAEITYAGAANLAATDVEAALDELDAEKLPLARTRTLNAQTGTAYTLVLADAGKFLTLDNAAAITLTVPDNATVAFPVGTVIEGAQLGAGRVTIAGATGVTLNADPGLNVAARYGTFGLLKTGANVWLAMGRLAA